MVLEKTLESPLDTKAIKPVKHKGNQLWIFIGRTDAEAETPILWPPDLKSRHIGKDTDAGKDWRQEEKRVTEDEIVGWHHWLNRHEFDKLWEIVRDSKPGVLQSMGSQRVGHNWATEPPQQRNCCERKNKQQKKKKKQTHKTKNWGDLKPQKFIFSLFWRPEAQNYSVCGVLASGGSEGEADSRLSQRLSVLILGVP